ncbi:DUF4245 domain-containing protein [Streptomyces sp. B6B3]|uniref:DUF4245 domain-containing protein n=1 Tax=Streptomyces sp. B6B3 TaxID=3153570 RepID=UPI00325E5EBD
MASETDTSTAPTDPDTPRAADQDEPSTPEGPETPETPEGPEVRDMPEDPAQPAQPRPPARRARGQTARNMLLSMALTSVGAFFLYLFIPHDESTDHLRPVAYDVESATAARVAPYELLVPEGLPQEWRANSVRYEPQGQHGATWRLGFVDPEEEYAALAQADGDSEGFVASITRQAEDTGSVRRIDGREWARYEGPEYDALVLREPGVTTVVLGTASQDGLAELASALEPRLPDDGRP